MGIRPNKTNFSLSFGDFRRANVKRRREEEDEKKRRRRGRREERYGNHVFAWIHDFRYENFEYGSVCMDISGSISRV